MLNIEMTREGYEGIPATEKTLTDADLRQWAVGKDVAVIPLAIAALKKAQESIVVTKAAFEQSGAEITALTLKVGDVVTLDVTREPAENTAAPAWTLPADETVVKAAVNPDDTRYVTIKAVAAGSVEVKCAVGAGTATVTVTVE